MHPDCLPSAHDDDKPASEPRTCDTDKIWLACDAISIGPETFYDQALIDDGTSRPILLYGEFKLVGHTWTDCTPAYLIDRDSKTIYPFHRIISLRVKAEEDDQSDE